MGRTLRGILSNPLSGAESLDEGGALMYRVTYRLAEALQLFGYVAAGIGAAIDFRGYDEALGSAARRRGGPAGSNPLRRGSR